MVALVGKNSPVGTGDIEVQVQSLGWEDSLEEEMATHSYTLAWRIPISRRARRATVHSAGNSRTWLKWVSRHVLIKAEWLSCLSNRNWPRQLVGVMKMCIWIVVVIMRLYIFSKFTELITQSRWVLLYVNHTSRRLLKIKAEKGWIAHQIWVSQRACLGGWRASGH